MAAERSDASRPLTRRAREAGETTPEAVDVAHPVVMVSGIGRVAISSL